MKPLFKCSFDEFFLACRLVLMSMQENLAAFNAHKTFYTAAFLDALLLELDALELLPDEEQREGQRERLLVNMKGKTRKEVKLIVNRLRSYIEEAFIKAEQKSALEEAGFKQYEKAMDFNWEEVKALLNKGNSFITAHNAVLVSPGGMPAVFVTDYSALKTEMLGKITLFLGLRQGTKEMTEARTVACNDFFLKIRKIMDDGQVIFVEQPAKKDRFVWDSVLNIVTPPGAAGLRGSVKDGLTLEPVAGAVLEFRDGVNPVIEATTNALGRYDSGNLASGNYTLKIIKAGYAVIETAVEIKLGTVSYKHWVLSEASGSETVYEGNLIVAVTANVKEGVIENPDATVKLEAIGMPMIYFASSTANGGATGAVINVSAGTPVEMKMSVLATQIGWDAINSFLNVQNIGMMPGGWKVTVTE